MKSDKTIDLRGLLCAMALARAKKETDNSEGILELIADSESVMDDVSLWAANGGYEILETAEGKDFRIFIRKKK